MVTILNPVVASQPVGTENYYNNTNNTQTSTAANTTTSYPTDKFTNSSVIPQNYPSVQGQVPTSIFDNPRQSVPANTTINQPTSYTQSQTYNYTNIPSQTPASLPVQNTSSTGPVMRAEIKWAIELEEKVQKQGYKPTQEELTKYQDIVVRIKAQNTKKGGPILTEIINVVNAQAPSLGANIGAQRVIPTISTAFTTTVNNIKAGGGLKAVLNGGKAIGMGVLKGMGVSALVSGIFSTISNGIAVLTGRETKADAVGSVAADVANGAVSGIGASLFGGAAMAGLGALGVAGLPLTLLVGGAALLGTYLGDKLFKKTGAYDIIQSKVSGMIGNR